ncbi:YdcF family protein [Candidatus Peregrinibacteria bacterium]|nr:MAG: YdcF family protein [Candidatus Peregrinibacteria bacterium]
MKFLRFTKKRLFLVFTLIVGALFCTPFVFFFFVSDTDFSLENAPQKPVAVIFGASAAFGKPSDIFSDRLHQGAKLYALGKVKKVLISGDNSHADYNEPVVGKMYLLKRGVPEEDIILDYAGFRTYDTCFRLRYIFHVESALLVTQSFHLPRALFLCRSFGIDSFGVAADLRSYKKTSWFHTREYVARWVSFWEVKFFRHNPKFLGDPHPVFFE